MNRRPSILRVATAWLILLVAGCDVMHRPAPPAPPAPPPAPVVKPTLLEAARTGDRAMVEELLQAGADLNEVDAERMTALHHAAMMDQVGIIQLLLTRQPALEARDLYACTPLHVAARQGHLSAVQALVEAGAEVRAADRENLTAYDMAAIMQHAAVADFLAARGGGPAVEAEVVEEPLAAPPPALLTGETFRVWTSLSGAQLEAEFVGAQFDEVQLRKPDASLVRIRLALLKPEDQLLVRQLAGHAPPRLVRSRGPRPDDPMQDARALRMGRDKAWTVLEGCTLLKRSANDGDSFHVRHDGKEYIFRLYYVDAPETSLSYPDRVREQADYFGLSDQAALRVGEEARKFSERILGAAPFTVVTSWEDARGNSRLPRQYAFVVTAHGELDELLAAEGLVRIYGMRVSNELGHKKDDVLKRLEKEAQREDLGGWGVAEHAGVTP